MADVIETDLTTDPPTITERAFTPEELAQREKDAADYAAAQAAAEQAAVEREAQRAVLLERLGLTADEFAVLVGGIA